MPIGFFQIDNLIRQRIHFFLFSAVDLSPLDYVAMEKTHLGQITTEVTTSMSSEGVAVMMLEKGIKKDAPIVFVCENGDWSKTVVDHLSTQGYINAFYALGGLSDMLASR